MKNLDNSLLLMTAFILITTANILAQMPNAKPKPSPMNPMPMMKKPDAQMKAILDSLAPLNPKPIETLTPQEARQQPEAITEAVLKLSERQMRNVTA